MTLFLPVLAASGALLLFLGLTTPPKRTRLADVLERLAVESGHGQWGAGRVLLLSVAAGVTGLLLAGLITSSAIVLVLGGVTGAWIPIAWLRARVRRRRGAHRDVWPEAIELLAAGVKAGMSLPEVVASLADRGPEALRGHFQRFRSTYRATVSFPAALDALAEDLADPVADRVVAALALAGEVGGTDLVRVLRTLGDFVRDDLRVRKEIEARWSWTVSAARLAAAAPWIVLVAMASRPEAAAAYDSSGGAMLVASGAVATFVGYRSMLRAARLPEDPRWRR